MHYILSLLTSNEIVDVVKALGDEIVGKRKQKSTTRNRIVLGCSLSLMEHSDKSPFVKGGFRGNVYTWR